MRVNLIARPSDPFKSTAGTIPLTLTVRPARGVSGNYECQMDSGHLMWLLQRQIDLPGYVLEDFEKKLRFPLGTRLLGVDVSDSVLSDIGYFAD